MRYPQYASFSIEWECTTAFLFSFATQHAQKQYVDDEGSMSEALHIRIKSCRGSLEEMTSTFFSSAISRMDLGISLVFVTK